MVSVNRPFWNLGQFVCREHLPETLIKSAEAAWIHRRESSAVAPVVLAFQTSVRSAPMPITSLDDDPPSPIDPRAMVCEPVGSSHLWRSMHWSSRDFRTGSESNNVAIGLLVSIADPKG